MKGTARVCAPDDVAVRARRARWLGDGVAAGSVLSFAVGAWGVASVWLLPFWRAFAGRADPGQIPVFASPWPPSVWVCLISWVAFVCTAVPWAVWMFADHRRRRWESAWRRYWWNCYASIPFGTLVYWLVVKRPDLVRAASAAPMGEEEIPDRV